MRIRFTILTVFVLIGINVFSQEDKPLGTLGKVDLGFSGLGLSVETPLSDKILLEIAAGLGAGYKIDEKFRYRFYFDDPSVFASVDGRYYYNRQKRVDIGKSVSKNAGNFFALKAKYTSPTICDSKNWHTLLIGFHWGMQRKMGKHFLYQFYIGVGAGIDLEDKTSTHMSLFPDANMRVSYVLPF